MSVRPPAAVLWDMDGLLVDSEPLWTVAESELADSLGCVWTVEVKNAVMGTRLERAVPMMLELLGAAHGPSEVRAASDFLLMRMVSLFEGGMALRPGAAGLLARVAEAQIPQALVSSSYRVLVDAVLRTLGAHPFVLTVAGDEVREGKPHPEPYLTAAAALGVRALDCLVLEDSPSGVASGEAAGAWVVAVPDGAPVPPGPGRLVVPSLHDVRAELPSAHPR